MQDDLRAGCGLTPAWALARGRARCVGEPVPVAVVAAEAPYVADDALDLIQVDWEPVPAVADVDAARCADPAMPRGRAIVGS